MWVDASKLPVGSTELKSVNAGDGSDTPVTDTYACMSDLDGNAGSEMGGKTGWTADNLQVSNEVCSIEDSVETPSC